MLVVMLLNVDDGADEDENENDENDENHENDENDDDEEEEMKMKMKMMMLRRMILRRKRDPNQDREALFVRACAVEKRKGMSKEPLRVEIYRENSRGHL